jgi:hypothetical protein
MTGTESPALSLFQHDIARRVGVPVATSSLMQAPFIERVLPPGRRVGILTISAAILTPEHLRDAGVSEDTPVVGTDDGREFSRVILGDELELDVVAAERDILDAGEILVRENPKVGAILLEFTNMSPFTPRLGELLRPVKAATPAYFLDWFFGHLAQKFVGR